MPDGSGKYCRECLSNENSDYCKMTGAPNVIVNELEISSNLEVMVNSIRNNEHIDDKLKTEVSSLLIRYNNCLYKMMSDQKELNLILSDMYKVVEDIESRCEK